MELSDTQHKLLHQSLLGPGIYLWIRICLLFRIHASQINQHLTSNGFGIRRLWRRHPLLFFQWLNRSDGWTEQWTTSKHLQHNTNPTTFILHELKITQSSGHCGVKVSWVFVFYAWPLALICRLLDTEVQFRPYHFPTSYVLSPIPSLVIVQWLVNIRRA